MKDWKHLTLEQRKVISNGISHNYKLKEIAEALGYDPTSISKEVKRNRESTTIGTNVTNCKKVNRWPYVCTGCNKKYNNQCCFTKYKYDAKKAQNKANLNLVVSRRGIDSAPRLDTGSLLEITRFGVSPNYILSTELAHPYNQKIKTHY